MRTGGLDARASRRTRRFGTISSPRCAKIPGVRVRLCEGGSYLFPRLPPLKVSLWQFIGALRAQAAMTVTPGTEFGPGYTDSFRINFSQDHRTAVAAVKRIGQMIERCRA